MLKLRNLNIGFRLFLGFLLLTLFTISVGLIALWNSNQNLSTIEDIFDHPYTVSNAVQEIETNIIAIHRSMKDVPLAQNEKELNLAIDAVAECEKNVNQLFKIVSKEFLGDLNDVSEAWDSFKSWKPIRLEVIDLAKKGERNQAAQITKGKGALHILEINKKIKIMKDFADQKARSFRSSALKQGQFIFRTILIILIISILLSVYIAFKITQSIRRPIHKMNAVSEAIQQGDLNIQNETSANDELNSLAEGINNMTHSLKSRMTVQNGISSISNSLIGETNTEKFAYQLLESILEVTDSNNAIFYILNEDRKCYECIASIGASKNTLQNFSLTNPPGEFGISIRKKKMQIIDGLQNHPGFQFTTSIGEYAPMEILSLPILDGNEVKAIISLSNLEKYTAESIDILSLSTLSINIAFENLISARKTKSLADSLIVTNQTLEAQSEELKEQTNELQEQSHEMQNQATELNEQNRILEAKKIEVEEANRLKSEFLSNMSHELRTPLNSIMALSRTLIMQAKDKLNEEENSYLEIVERNGTNLLQLINDILDLSKIEAGKMDVYPRQIQLKPILKLLQENIQPLAIQKGIELEINCNNTFPGFDSDEVRLSQILTNLIGNAVKFTEKGKVIVSAFHDEEKITIEVQDSGIGISKKNLETIFDEFRQIDGSSSRQYEGTGLGLAIVNKLINILGGKISVTSEINKGSCFTITIPIVWHLEKEASPFLLYSVPYSENTKNTYNPSGPSVQLNPDNQNNHTSTLCKPRENTRILMIEDNETAIIQMKQVLELEGYTIDIANGGKEALEFVNHTIPDGIILDLMMPEIDGFEVLERIRSKENTANIPVVILTAKDLTREDLSRLSANNVQQLIQKGDINIKALLEKIHKMFGEIEKVEPSEYANRICPKINLDKNEKAKVLIIEDNPDNMVTIKAILGDKYEIHEAIDGEQGLTMVDLINPHLILLDMALPKIDGLEVVKRIKSNTKNENIPVIALTAMAMIEDKEAILKAGCDEYVTKPVGHLEILTKIENFFI
ncbi:response regulator [Labilibaculum sp. DW002]|uniref:histidine kinase n=1 Tax=Paralabilibaculum antarcticum TaxID=2912572 RepID=A0ABT5VUM6_9BACT|nr:response regulator [Labilibaculum sp. DW002]MDE5419027.1 response regulator [Labilibaculum sp. DW002]